MTALKAGDLLFLTAAYDSYVRERHPDLKVVLTNRLAKLEEIIDWETEKGKIIKEARKKSGKWAGLNIEDCRYLVTVYYHEINGRQGQSGVVERCIPIFKSHPKSKEPFFIKVPDWIYKDFISECKRFEVKNVS